MEASSFKLACILGLLVAFGISGLDAAGECGKSSTPDKEAMKLAPCADAAADKNAAVSASCCQQVSSIIRVNPRCLCAVMLSDTAKNAGINPEIAITIPMRCNIANRPKGSKCGAYTLP